MRSDEIPLRVHFVGIGGVGMSGLAQYLHRTGHIVSGSDRQPNDRTAALSDMGVAVRIGHSAANIGDAQLVVRTSAVAADNVEVAAAASGGKQVVLREELLGAVFNSFRNRIAVCGTHGKTTVTAMIHEILCEAHIDHTALIGGVYRGNNFYYGSGTVVAEACEYNRSFLNLAPTVCVCLNAEYDHPDCYAGAGDVRRAFAQFMSNTAPDGVVVLPQKLRGLCRDRRVCCYDDFSVDGVVLHGGKPTFTATIGGKRRQFSLNTVGAHNVGNALAAIAAVRQLNVPLSCAQRALARFDGVDRRWTVVSGARHKVVVDYAHHPTEIACAIDAARSLAPGRVICVFQPHTYSRTQAFFRKFATCFGRASSVAYLPVYSAREQPIEGVNSQKLAEYALSLGMDAAFVPNFAAACAWVEQKAAPDDIVLVLGAGDVCNLAGML